MQESMHKNLQKGCQAGHGQAGLSQDGNAAELPAPLVSIKLSA